MSKTTDKELKEIKMSSIPYDDVLEKGLTIDLSPAIRKAFMDDLIMVRESLKDGLIEDPDSPLAECVSENLPYLDAMINRYKS